MIQSKEAFSCQLGNTIRKYRQHKRLTVEELAWKAGLSYSQISRIELGKIMTSAYTLYVIAQALEIDTDQLFNSILLKEEVR